MTEIKRTKKQHYIAQGIIKAFFDSNSIYEKNLQNGRVYKTSINNTMCMNDFYEFSLLEDNFLENLFATSVDEDSSKLIKNLKKILDKDNCLAAKNEIFKYIRLFLINYYKSITSLIHMSKETTKNDRSSIVRMMNTIFDMKYIERISEVLLTGYDFSIIKSFNKNFVLTDQYIATCSLKFMGCFINISNREIGLKNTLVLVPISSEYYAMFVNGQLPDNFIIESEHINKLTEIQTEIINNVIYNNSYEKCIALNEKEINKLKKKNSTLYDSEVITNFKSLDLVMFKVKQEVFFTDDEYEMYKYYESLEWADKKFGDCGANNLCPCGSNKKYKKCCRDKVKRCNRILNMIHYQQDDLLINKKNGIEKSVQLSNYENKELQNKFKFLKNS